MRLAAALVLALAACADPSTVGQEPTPTPTASHAYAAGELVLQVRHEGGLVPADTLADIPFWSLYGDRTVIVRGPETAIYPGQALPNLQTGNVTRETLDTIVREAYAAGIDGVERDYGDPPVADASTTVFVLNDGRQRFETRVYALSEAEDRSNAARAKLSEFLSRLTTAEPDHGFGGISDDEPYVPYVPAALAVYAKPYGTAPRDITPQDATWTGPDPATGETTAAGTCTVLTGAALAAALPAFRTANTLTRWHTQGAVWSFVLRPLLPDEKTCADGLPADHSQ